MVQPTYAQGRRELIAVLAFALVLRVVVILAFPNFHHADEVFQALEPAHLSWTGFGVITWEWREGIRSWILPGFISVLMRMTGDLGPQVYLPLIQSVLATISLLIVYGGYRFGEWSGGRKAALFVSFSCAIWPDLVYFAGKSLTEAVATPFLVLACCLASAGAPQALDRRRLLAIGVLLGVAFCLRFHLAFGLLTIALWVCRLDFRRWLWLSAGAAGPLMVSGAVDWATLGTPFQSIWKNVWLNIVVDRSRAFGVNGPLFFPYRAVLAWGPASVALAVGCVAGFRKAPLFLLCGAAIWLTFISIPHKEYRFVYPATPLIVIAASVGWLQILQKWRGLSARKNIWPVAYIAVIACCASSLAMPFWRENLLGRRDEIAAFLSAGRRADLCGLGVVGVYWSSTGGYSYLHREVPVAIADDAETLRAGANYLVAPSGFKARDYESSACWRSICLLRRPGICAPVGANAINPRLEQRNE